MNNERLLKSARESICIQAESIKFLENQINSDFEALCKKILKIKGKLILMGVGKSGHIAEKISATLASTGTPSFFIHPTEAAHGDLGMIDKNDLILIFLILRNKRDNFYFASIKKENKKCLLNYKF